MNTEKLTPGKKPLVIPAKALADAIDAEGKGTAKCSPATMPLTALAYTAIDRIAGSEAAICEALLVYIDTDTLSYRASDDQKKLAQRQKAWDDILAWAKKTYGATWVATQGIMPLDQSPELHAAIGKRLHQLDAFQLAGLSVLASGYSSLALALAVLENHVDANEGFRLSRLEEEVQAEQWGREEEAEKRAARLQAEILTAGRFLSLLKTP